MIEAYRTPEDRFADLPGYDFAPHYFEWDGLRVHYADAGDGPPVVLFHGEPTWGFLYRKVAGPLRAAGYRVILPDYPGFGRSDKPLDPGFYTYARHTAVMTALVEHLDLADATAVVQDWGGPIGLRVAVEQRARFSRLSILNTGLFTGRGRVSPGFADWRAYVERTPDLPVGRVMRRSAVVDWPTEVIAAYDAPFPEPAAKAGARQFPLIVPLAPEDPGAAEMLEVREALADWRLPAQVLFSTRDPIFGIGTAHRLAAMIPGAGEADTLDGAGHFLQEDRGEEVGRRIAAFLQQTD